MEKKRDVKGFSSLRYLSLYILGSIILVVSYVKGYEGFFLFGLMLMVVAIFLYFLNLTVNKKIIIKGKTKKVKIKEKKSHFKFPRLRFPKISLPRFKLPKFNLKLPKMNKEKIDHPKIHTISPQETRKLKFIIKESGGITETDFDRLVNIVNQVDSIKISAVAKIFNITEKKAEEWGKILESHNLISVHYPPFGEPELRKWNK